MHTELKCLRKVLEWKARGWEVTAVSLGALPHSQLPLSCDEYRISDQVPGCPGILALGVFINFVPSMDDGCGRQEL